MEGLTLLVVDRYNVGTQAHRRRF